MPDAFASVAFQSSLAIEAILFGVFGFLYSVYGMYSSVTTPEHPARAPICGTLRSLCRGMAALIALNAVLAIYSLIILSPVGTDNAVLSAGLVISVLGMAAISLWMAFRAME